MAYTLFYDPRPVMVLDTFEAAPGGTLAFFVDGDTGTPKNVYSTASGTSLGSTVTLDTAGRSPTPIYLDGAYTVRLLDADNEQVWETDGVNNLGDGGLVPLDPADGDEDDVYSTDGVTASWRSIREVPDPTGSSGKYLGTDGDVLQWTAFPTATEMPTIDTPATTQNSYRDVDGMRECWGSGTATATGSGMSLTKAITFPAAFGGSGPHHVSVTPLLSGGVTSNAVPGFPAVYYNSPTTTGCTVGFFVGEENLGGTDAIVNNIPFTYKAIGPTPT